MHKTESSLLITLWNVDHKSLLKSHRIYKLLEDNSKWGNSMQWPRQSCDVLLQYKRHWRFSCILSFPMDKGGAAQQDQAALTRIYTWELAILDT